MILDDIRNVLDGLKPFNRAVVKVNQQAMNEIHKHLREKGVFLEKEKEFNPTFHDGDGPVGEVLIEIEDVGDLEKVEGSKRVKAVIKSVTITS